MRSIFPPLDASNRRFEPIEVFKKCVSMVSDPELRAKLTRIAPLVRTASDNYDQKAIGAQLYQTTSRPPAARRALDGELVKLYTKRMVPKGSVGRAIYDRIMATAGNRQCPFCGIGTVNQLDHYLPKTHFPLLSVTPNNLIPACTWCQGAKHEYFATTQEAQILHPYFDDLDADEWLVAEVVQVAPAVFQFSASPPAHWSSTNKARVEKHLEQLKLGVLFSSNAACRLTEIRSWLLKLWEHGGQEAVRDHLDETLESIESEHRNSWTAAMFRAASKSQWFCDGGFR